MPFVSWWLGPGSLLMQVHASSFSSVFLSRGVVGPPITNVGRGRKSGDREKAPSEVIFAGCEGGRKKVLYGPHEGEQLPTLFMARNPLFFGTPFVVVGKCT